MHLNPLLQFEITVSQPKMRITFCSDRFGRKVRKKKQKLSTTLLCNEVTFIYLNIRWLTLN